MVVPIAAAVVLAYQLSLHDQSNRAEIMASVVLNRAAITTEQLNSTFQRMAVFKPAEACSGEAIALMRQIDLSSSLLQGVGYVENNVLKCSSLGEELPVDVGVVDYVSSTDTSFRRQRELSIAPKAPLLLVTARSGFTGLVHPSLVFNLSDDGRDLPSGVVSYSTRERIISSGGALLDWSKADMPEGQYAGTLTMGDQLVAWSRSQRWDHFTYAAIPLAAVTEEFGVLGRFFVPVGILAGLAALLILRRLVASRTSLHALLRVGLRRGEIRTVYQPIADMRTGHWAGAEVLARWRRPSGEWIAPDLFVPLAEKHGLITQLTRMVIGQSLDDLAAFIGTHAGFFISVNVSSADLREPGFVEGLMDACAERGVPHAAIHLEITERAEVDPETEADAIRDLRAAGFQVGIDDFGIGYSNLAYLDMLKLDYLKIDRAFVAGIPGNGIGTEIVDHIIELAKGRGLQLIAEGIEHDGQRAELVSRGVRLGQGWLFARPMARLDFIRAYAANLAVVPEGAGALPFSRVA